jgi:hypothetical protein
MAKKSRESPPALTPARRQTAQEAPAEHADAGPSPSTWGAGGHVERGAQKANELRVSLKAGGTAGGTDRMGNIFPLRIHRIGVDGEGVKSLGRSGSVGTTHAGDFPGPGVCVSMMEPIRKRIPAPGDGW